MLEQYFFFEIRVFYELMWKNMAEPDRSRGETIRGAKNAQKDTHNNQYLCFSRGDNHKTTAPQGHVTRTLRLLL